jgi:hypothetical protein
MVLFSVVQTFSWGMCRGRSRNRDIVKKHISEFMADWEGKDKVKRVFAHAFGKSSIC